MSPDPHLSETDDNSDPAPPAERFAGEDQHARGQQTRGYAHHQHSHEEAPAEPTSQSPAVHGQVSAGQVSTDQASAQKSGHAATSGTAEAGITGEFNYFAAGEQQAQAEFRSARDHWLNPLVKKLLSVGVTAEVVSAAALGMLIPFGIGLWMAGGILATLLVIGGLVLHVALDGLDGPVARAAGTAGPAGAFTDMCLDHVGFLIVTSLLAAASRIDGAIACIYLSSYTVAIVLVVALNLLGQPLRFIIRTKYLFYGLIALQQLQLANWLNPMATGFSVIHGLTAVVAFVIVRRALMSANASSCE